MNIVFVHYVFGLGDFYDVGHVGVVLVEGGVVGLLLVVVVIISSLGEFVNEGAVVDVLNKGGVKVVSDVGVSWAVVVVVVVVVGIWVREVVGRFVVVGAVSVTVADVTVFPAVGVLISVNGGSLVLWVVPVLLVPWVGVVVAVV